MHCPSFQRKFNFFRVALDCGIQKTVTVISTTKPCLSSATLFHRADEAESRPKLHTDIKATELFHNRAMNDSQEARLVCKVVSM